MGRKCRNGTDQRILFYRIWTESRCIGLFALSTILSWALYGSRCCEFLFGTKYISAFQALFVAAIVLGATLKLELVWDIADTLNGFMAIPNLIAILCLSGVVIKLTKAHFTKS